MCACVLTITSNQNGMYVRVCRRVAIAIDIYQFDNNNNNNNPDVLLVYNTAVLRCRLNIRIDESKPVVITAAAASCRCLPREMVVAVVLLRVVSLAILYPKRHCPGVIF